MRRPAAVAAALAALCVSAAPAHAQERPKYDVRLLAKVPEPGFVSFALVAPDRTIYGGSFKNASDTPNGPSKVFAWTPDGQLKQTYTVEGQDPNANNGVQVATHDANGLLYLLDQNPARVITLDPRTGAQSTYATFRDVPPCPPPGVGNQCSATLADNPPYPNYAAWGPDRALYVTDFLQGLIWRVPPGGGVASVWFTDSALDGLDFGPAGIVLKPDRQTLLLSTLAGGPTTPTAANGKLFALGIRPDGSAGELDEIWQSGAAEAPDGFALAESGTVYIALVGPTGNAIAVISPTGEEIARITHEASGPDDVPFDGTASATFDGDRLIVTNNAFVSGNTANQALFDVFAGEPGAPTFIPPKITPATRQLADATVRPRRVRTGRRVKLRLHVFPAGQPTRGVKGARAQVKGVRSKPTGRRGRTRLTVRFHRPGRRAVKFTKGGRTIARAYVRVVRR
jgi:sugar lactone lactonase YvrE